MILNPETEAADILWLQVWGKTLLSTCGACCCYLPVFNHHFIEATGREPGPRVQLMFRQLAEKNQARMRERGQCISTAEVLATVAQVMGAVVAEPLACETE